MSNIEKQMNAVIRCLAAETEEDREQAREDLRKMAGISTTATTNSVENTIMDVLLDLGVPCHIKGYQYLITAIGAAVEDPTLIGAVTTALYPLVAEKHGTTSARAERAIRHAIECGFDRCDLDAVIRYFGNTISIDKGKPTNSEFIARVANVVRLRMHGAA